MPGSNFKLRISVDQSVCIAAGQCVASAHEVFDQRDEDGVVSLLQASPDPALYDKVMDAVRCCPSGAITVEKLQDN